MEEEGKPGTPLASTRAVKRSSSSAYQRREDDDGTPAKTMWRRGAAKLMRKAAQKAPPASTDVNDALMHMMRLLIAQATGHFETTDESNDGIGGRLNRNEVRVAHLEVKLEAHEGLIRNHFGSIPLALVFPTPHCVRL